MSSSTRRQHVAGFSAPSHGAAPRPARRGFTLVELLVVIAILATLAAIALGLDQGARQHAAISRARAELAGLSLAVEQYRRHYGDYPQTADSPERLYRALAGRIGPTGAAVQGRSVLDGLTVSLKDPDHPDAEPNCVVDPWGHAYQYVYFTRQAGAAPRQRGIVLFSFGPRNAAEVLPTREQVVPCITGEHGGDISASALNAKNIYAGQ